MSFIVFVSFMLIWWIVFLCILPVMVKVDDKPKLGFASSAPTHPYIWQKMLISTIVSIILTAILLYFRSHNYIKF